MTPKEAIIKAVQIIGGYRVVADYFGISRQAVHHWIAREGQAPSDKALRLEELCNGKVKKTDLRPDIF